jgi:hypothetical protein
MGAINQALLELRLAVELEPSLMRTAAPMALRMATNTEQLARAVPDGALGGDFLELVGTLSTNRKLAWREDVDRLALERNPELKVPRLRLVDRRLDAIPRSLPPCEDPELCRLEVEDHAERLKEGFPASSLSAQARGRLAMALGDYPAAADTLRAECDLPDDQPVCLQLLLRALASQPDAAEEISAVIDRFVRTGCSNRNSCAAAHSWVAEFRSSRGEWSAAMVHQERACGEDGSETCWRTFALTAEKAGAYNRAADAFEKAFRIGGGTDPTLRARIDENRRRALP